MKKIIFLTLSGFVFNLCELKAQKIISQAIVQSEIVTDDIVNSTSIPKVEMTTWIKGNNLKITSKNEYSETYIFIDRGNEKIVSLFEIMGKKIGFFVYDTSQVNRKYIADSTTIKYLDSSLVINGFPCKKAIFSYAKSLNTPDVEVWYSTEYKFKDRNLGLNVLGLEQLQNAIISFKTLSNNNNFLVTYEVKKIEQQPKLDDSIFVIPKTYEIKTYDEFSKIMSRQGN